MLQSHQYTIPLAYVVVGTVHFHSQQLVSLAFATHIANVPIIPTSQSAVLNKCLYIIIIIIIIDKNFQVHNINNIPNFKLFILNFSIKKSQPHGQLFIYLKYLITFHKDSLYYQIF